jgi:DNA polymerase III subunit epsilon
MNKKRKEFPLDRINEIHGRPENFQLLERVPLTLPSASWPMKLSESVGDEKKMVLLDVESTGGNIHDDEITELGMVSISYSPSAGKVISIEKAISLFDDPGKPIPEKIIELTGITDDMVKGEKIDEELVVEWLQNTTYIVAHYAYFDRNMFEKRFSRLNEYKWACSIQGIDWESLGFKNLSLDVLLMRLGWFFDAHRATVDCLAMAWLFHLVPEALQSLISKAQKRSVRIHAVGAPFSVKDYLKERNYHWFNDGDVSGKYWWREVPVGQLEEEKYFLDNLYQQGSKKAEYFYLDASNRYKKVEH